VSNTEDHPLPGAGVAREVAARLLIASKDATAHGVDVPAGKVKTFAAAYSWWRFICRSAEAVLLLGERGFTIEASPVLRNVVNHAYALNWLVDNGDPAIRALMAESIDEAEKLCRKLERFGWPAAVEYRSMLEERKSQAAAVLERADQKLHGKLKQEAHNFYDMLDHYASANAYPVYSHLSSMSHTSMETANAYLHWRDDGTFQLRDTAESPGDAATFQVAFSLLQAAVAISRLIDGDPMRATIDSALAALGLQESELFQERDAQRVPQAAT
jgi:hypothetical protein